MIDFIIVCENHKVIFLFNTEETIKMNVEYKNRIILLTYFFKNQL